MRYRKRQALLISVFYVEEDLKLRGLDERPFGFALIFCQQKQQGE